MRIRVAILLLAFSALLLPRMHADGPPAIFADARVAKLTLEAPIDELLAHSERQDGTRVAGRVTLAGGDTPVVLDPVKVSVRGHTSRSASECDFPKLKLDLSAADRRGTPFEHVKAIKIGTHCGDRPDSALTARYGRLANEREPLRESLVYQMLRAAGVPTLLTRPARITYVDSTHSRPTLERNGMLLEDDDEAASRLGAQEIIEEGSFDSAQSQFAEADTARLLFAEAMIGNFDWCLRMSAGDTYRCDSRHPLWNVLAMRRQSPPDVPLIYDFDLAGPVVGRHVWFDQVFDRGFTDPPSSAAVEVQSQVQRTRSVFGRSTLDATREAFIRARPAVLAVVEGAPVDDQGRRLAREYVTAFYDSIADGAFYRPVVVKGGNGAFADPESRRPACGGRTLVPAGTPVSSPLETRGDMVQVRILDALWAWTGEHRCDAIHRDPVWMASSVIGTDYPR